VIFVAILLDALLRVGFQIGSLSPAQ
jgi:hypothetical protein